MKGLALIILLLVLIYVVVTVVRAARARAATAAGEPYRVLQTTSGSDAQVLIGRGTKSSQIFIGSVPISEPDFDERFGELVSLAEDRAATLNANRQLQGD